MDPVILTSSILGAVLGFALRKFGRRLVSRKNKPVLSSSEMVSIPFRAVLPGFQDFLQEHFDDAIPRKNEANPPEHEGWREEASVFSSLPAPIELSRCPCGLVLPDASMWEHSETTGHTGMVSMNQVRIGKIWELGEAMIERASPSCYRCGKPVRGLKRIGKTIYVTHLGCMEKNAEPQAGNIPKPKGVMEENHPRRIRRIYRCPICWQPAKGRRGFITTASSAGGTIKFHDYCLGLESQVSTLNA